MNNVRVEKEIWRVKKAKREKERDWVAECLYWRFWLHIWATCALSLGAASQMKDTLYPRSAASALVPMEKNQPARRNTTQSDKKKGRGRKTSDGI